MGSNVRQDSVPTPAAPLVVLSNLVNIPPWSRRLPASQVGVEVLSEPVDKATRSGLPTSAAAPRLFYRCSAPERWSTKRWSRALSHVRGGMSSMLRWLGD